MHHLGSTPTAAGVGRSVSRVYLANVAGSTMGPLLVGFWLLDHAPLERAFAAGLTFRTGTCSVPEELPALFPLVQSGRLRPEKYISHRMPLSEGAEAYRLFEAREAGALKMVLTPE